MSYRRRYKPRKRNGMRPFRRIRRRRAMRPGGYLNKMKAELKNLDVNISGSTDNTANPGILVNGIAQGTDIFERIGRKIVVRSIQFKGLAFQEEAADCTMRIMGVIDHQPNGVLATIEDVLDDVSGAVSVTHFRKLANRERFKIFFDKSINLSPKDVNNGQYSFSFYKKCFVKTLYSGLNDGIADIATNSIIIFTWSTEAALTAPNIGLRVRIRYVDS